MKAKGKRKFKASPSHKSQDRLLGETIAYLLGSVVYPFRNKWGITDHENLRRAQVDKEVSGPVYKISAGVVIFAWQAEHFVHWLYHFQNAPIKKTTGGTEWFYNFSPLVGTAYLYLSHRFGFENMYVSAAAYLFPFIWWDGLFWLIFFRFMGLVLAAVLFFGTCYFYQHTHWN